ncbi:helix-turn-helix domain-containing protein [Paenibacillus periandrae]|uniref:helix-turn-helix domain-containing protein n=1 Tax=Paenibacillus periandrae TaxID=1761741 RepID=UPI001F09ACA2|nr:helix-turn-helix domain-containing protein [Paenibacillus periandrae]
MKKENELEILVTAMKETNSTRMYERYLAVRLHLVGRTLTEIAGSLKRTYQTVSTYWNTYRNQGLSGLDLGHSPGGPKKLTEEQEDKVKATITTLRPVDVGFKARHTWTLNIKSNPSSTDRGTQIKLVNLRCINCCNIGAHSGL